MSLITCAPAPTAPPIKAVVARLPAVIGCPVRALTTTVAPTLVAAPARALPIRPPPMSGSTDPMPPATPPPRAPCNRLSAVIGLPVTRLIAAPVPAPVKAPTAMGLVTPRLVTRLVMGFRLVPENKLLAVPPAVPAPVGARLLISAGSTPLISCAVSAAVNSVKGATAPPAPEVVAMVSFIAASGLAELAAVAIVSVVMPFAAPRA